MVYGWFKFLLVYFGIFEIHKGKDYQPTLVGVEVYYSE